MNPTDVVLVLVFTVVWPLFDARRTRRLLEHAVARKVPGARSYFYLGSVITEWTFAALALAACLTAGRDLSTLRLPPPTGAGVWISLVAIGLAVGLLLLQSRSIAASPEATRAQAAPLKWFMPHSARDRANFRLLSVTAGVCEEWFFRGYVLGLLEPSFGLWGAVAASTALFGLAHAYQGPLGILRTGIVGLLMAGLTVVTGSIWAPIVVHALADWIQGDQIAGLLADTESDAPEAPDALEPQAAASLR